MIQFPNIDPEIFSVHLWGYELALRWYAVSYILGFYFALVIMKSFVRREFFWFDKNPPINEDQADAILTYLILGVIIGGRLGYVLFYNLDFYITHPLNIVRIWDGGMAFHGGFIGVILAVILFSKIHRVNLWSLSDLIAVAATPGLFFGRVANFINAELWGRPTSLPWGVVFPGERAQSCEGVLGTCARHPTQIYEAGAEGLFLFVLLAAVSVYGGLRHPGLITGIFAAVYGGARFFIEYFRVPDPQFFAINNPMGFAWKIGEVGLTMGQVLSVPMILVGIYLIIRNKKSSAIGFEP